MIQITRVKLISLTLIKNRQFSFGIYIYYKEMDKILTNYQSFIYSKEILLKLLLCVLQLFIIFVIGLICFISDGKIFISDGKTTFDFTSFFYKNLLTRHQIFHHDMIGQVLKKDFAIVNISQKLVFGILMYEANNSECYVIFLSTVSQ